MQVCNEEAGNEVFQISSERCFKKGMYKFVIRLLLFRNRFLKILYQSSTHHQFVRATRAILQKLDCICTIAPACCICDY